jgi:hypothetical protein
MAERLRFEESEAGFELRRGEQVVGVAGPATEPRARVEAGGAAWELAIEGERDALAGTWQVVAREPGVSEPVAVYFHGSMRGGRVRAPGERWGSLRRELGVSAEWRLRFPDAAMAIRPFVESRSAGLDLEFVPGSAEVPDLFLLLICWSVVSEETLGPPRRAG